MVKFLILALLLLTVPLAATAEEVIAPTLDLSSWQTALVTGLGLLIAWGFKLWRSKQKATTQHEELDATKSLWEQRNFLIDNRIIPFAMNTAEHWLMTQLGAIMRDAVDGDGFDWKRHWGSMRLYVRSRVLQKFASENLDVLTILTERELDNLVDRLLVKLISNLPPYIQALVPESVSDKLGDYASAFLADKAQDLLGIENK